MESILSIDQQRVIVDDINHLLICLDGLTVNTGLLTLLKMLRDMNSPSYRCRDYPLSNFFQSSYFTEGGVIPELLVPFLRFVGIYIMIWFTFKVTTFYHVHWPAIKRYMDEMERPTNELQNISENTSDNEDSITEEGAQPLEDEFGNNPTEEVPRMIADI